MALVNDVAASALYPLVHSFLSDCGLSGTASALRKEIGKSSKKLAKDQVTLGIDKDLVEIVNVYRKSLAKEESTSEEEESESSSDDDSNKEEESEEDNDEEEDNERLVKKSGKVSADSSSSSSSSSREEVEAPVAVRKDSVKRKAGGKKRTVKEAIAAESSEEEEEKPVPKAKVNGKVKKADAAKKKIASKPDSSVGKVETKCSKKRKAVSTSSSSEGDASGDGSEGGSEDDKPPLAKRLKIDARAAKVAPKRGKVDSSSSSSSSSDISSSSEEESDSDSGEDSSSDESSDEEDEAQRAVAKASAEKERRKSAAAAAAAWVPKALTTPNGGGASEVANGDAKTPENKHGGKANGTGGNKGSGGRQGEAFKRVKDEHWVGSLKEGFDNNTYEATFGQGGYGFKASEKLSKVRGKDFRHEKTKKKRGSYRGGEISMNSYSVKFEDSD